MTQNGKPPLAPAAQRTDDPGAPAGLDLDRVSRLIDDLEQELARAPADALGVQDLREEVETLKDLLRSPNRRHGWIRDSLHSLRLQIEKTAANVGGELRSDGPFLTEIGRILGL